MQIRRRICAVLVGILVMSTLAIPVNAAENVGVYSENNIRPLASAGFEFTLSANEKKEVNSEFFLAAGETIEIEATYDPASADVDFIIAAPNGRNYRYSGTDGSFGKTVRVPENGSYSLIVRNNSDSIVEVTGEVYY